MNFLNGFYAIIIILVALVSIIRGFRTGISNQIASILGMAFGAVGARVLLPYFTPHFQWALSLSQEPEFNDITVNLVCAVCIYTLIFILFSFLSPIFRNMFIIFGIGIINRLCGSFFSLVKNLLWVSIVLNLMLCISSKSGLLYYERSNDGNLIGAVMAITPAILGCYGAEDFALYNQLREAKYISYEYHNNFNRSNYVILKQKRVIFTSS